MSGFVSVCHVAARGFFESPPAVIDRLTLRVWHGNHSCVACNCFMGNIQNWLDAWKYG